MLGVSLGFGVWDLVLSVPGRLTSRPSPFEGECGGANPSPATNFSLGDEIGSWLSYKQHSKGQNLPERPLSIASLHNQECAGL